MINFNSKGVWEMAKNRNFGWLKEDIYSTVVLNVMYNQDNHLGVFQVSDVLETTGDKLEVETANIDDLTNFLTLGVVRFVNVLDNNDFLDVPFRYLYKLYDNANQIDRLGDRKMLSFTELDLFAIIDGVVRDDLFLYCTLIDKVSDDLNEIMKIAFHFGNYGMQEKFDAMSNVTLINHKRLLIDGMNIV